MKKSIIHYLLALIYLVALAASAVIAIKPGASIFYFKRNMDKQVLEPEAGFTYKFHLKVNPVFLRPQETLLYEDGVQLKRSDRNTVNNSGKGAYSLSGLSRGVTDIYFSASDNSDPTTNGRTYHLYIPYRFISRSNGIIYLLILSVGLFSFLYFALTVPEYRRTIIHSPLGVLKILDRFFENISEAIAADTGPVGPRIKARAMVWERLFTAAVLVSFFYVFMEWLFFVTKPSFMSILTFSEKADVLILSGLAFSVSILVFLAIFIGLDLVAVFACRSGITRHLGTIIPTLILSALALILIDNFTYTVFKFGISTSSGIGRGIYAGLFVFLTIYIFTRMLKYLGLKGKEKPKNPSLNRLFYLSLCILFVSAVLAVARLDFKGVTSVNKTAASQQAIGLPNIILLGSDGVSAKNMSVYGYERDTTPILREYAKSMLVAENAFTNSGNSPGSVFSILTGKLPGTTRVGFSPDILTGVNAFQHLPGILKTEGYKTVEFAVPTFIDAYSFNMQNGFDMVNNRSQNTGKLGIIVRKLGFDNAAYFLDNLTGRISDRVQHIFYMKDMQNPYNLVTRPGDSLSDKEKIHQLLNLFDQSEQPLFVHVHLMGTHGEKFAPPIQVFSKGETQDTTWMVDFYDDSVLSFDNTIGEVIDHLKAIGKYENTILIIYTDHAMEWQVDEHVPLIFHFPGNVYAGRITQNVQNLDIAPTVLDYLGLPEPEWMAGNSLLKSNLGGRRLIFAMGTIQATQSNGSGERFIDPSLIKPPFYQFGYVDIVDCQKWYRFNLQTLAWRSGDIKGNVDPCPQQSPLSLEEIRQAMIHRLELDGFDTSSIK